MRCWRRKSSPRGRDTLALLGKWASFQRGVVLDLACGQGIKTTSYAVFAPELSLGVGVDIDAKALEAARAFSRGRGVERAAFVRTDAGALPFKDQSVDVVITENAFEHVPHPQATLQETARVLRDQGILSLRFFPLYYSRFGAHLWDYLRVPWVHVWASLEAVAAAYGRIIQAEAPRLLREFAGPYDERDLKSYVANRSDRAVHDPEQADASRVLQSRGSLGGLADSPLQAHRNPTGRAPSCLLPGAGSFHCLGDRVRPAT